MEEVNFKKLATIYKEAMARITPTSVPVLKMKLASLDKLCTTKQVMSSLGFVALKDRSTNAWTTLQLLLETGRKGL